MSVIEHACYTILHALKKKKNIYVVFFQENQAAGAAWKVGVIDPNNAFHSFAVNEERLNRSALHSLSTKPPQSSHSLRFRTEA